MIELKLELEEINGILISLGNMPYAQVQPLIEKVRSQVAPQLKPEIEKA